MEIQRRLIVINSGSKGNGYILECVHESLIIEVGVNVKSILKSLNFEEGIGKVRGCLVSHL